MASSVPRLARPMQCLSDMKDDTDIDEELDAAAQGDMSKTDGGPDHESEIDAIGEAAGVRDNPKKAFRGIAKVEERDAHRWELDPKSKDPDTGIS
jgi:hypothetical protein